MLCRTILHLKSCASCLLCVKTILQGHPINCYLLRLGVVAYTLCEEALRGDLYVIHYLFQVGCDGVYFITILVQNAYVKSYHIISYVKWNSE